MLSKQVRHGRNSGVLWAHSAWTAGWLIALAAGGLLMITIGAVFFHLAHHERKQAIGVVLLIILLACIAYLRWQVMPL